MDRIFWSCLPFGYVGVFLLLHFGTDLSISLVCAIALLIGDAPGAMLAAIIIGSLSLLRKCEEHPGTTVRNSARAHSVVAPRDQSYAGRQNGTNAMKDKSQRGIA